jgi:hypothetical protein
MVREVAAENLHLREEMEQQKAVILRLKMNKRMQYRAQG